MSTIYADWAPPAPDRYGRYSVSWEHLPTIGCTQRYIIGVNSAAARTVRQVQARSLEELIHLIEGMRAEQWPEYVQ